MYRKIFSGDPETRTGFIRLKYQQKSEDVASGPRNVRTERWWICTRFN